LANCPRGSPVCGVFFDPQGKQKQIALLEEQTLVPNFWGDPANAKKVLKEKAQLSGVVDDFQKTHARIDDASQLFELARAEGDAGVLEETDRDHPVVEDVAEEEQPQRVRIEVEQERVRPDEDVERDLGKRASWVAPGWPPGRAAERRSTRRTTRT